MTLTLRSKLLLTAGGLQALVLVVSLGAAYRIFSQTLIDELQRDARLTRQVLLPALIQPLVERDFAELQDTLAAVTASDGRSLQYLQVLDSAGRQVAAAGLAPTDLGNFPGQAEGLAREGMMRFDLPVAAAASPGVAYGRLRFGLSLDAHDAGLARLNQALVVIGMIGLSLGLLLQGLLARALTQRLRGLVENAQALQERRQLQPLPISGDDEITQLSRAFNAMSLVLLEQLSTLEAAEQRQRRLIEAVNDGVLLYDDQLRVINSNSAAQRILGLSADQLAGRAPIQEAFRLLDAQEHPLEPQYQPSVRAWNSGLPVRNEVLAVQRPDGSRVWIQSNAEPMFLPGESRPYALATSFADITARVEAERQLRQHNEILDQRVHERTLALEAARAQAEAANLAKSHFLSRMSHELRTPLNAILGFAQILLHRPEAREPREREMLGHVESAGWHLLELINDVLDLSRIETDTLSVSNEPVALAPLCQETLRMAEPLARAQDIRPSFDPDSVGELRVLADKTRLRQVLMNLLSNAIKYNRRGGEVALRLEVRGEDWLGLKVSDSGVGMSAAQLERLFEPFNRLGAENTAVQGTGIGLVITRHLVAMMGGTLEVHSEPGRGTEFIVMLRRASAVLTPPLPSLAAAGGLSVAPQRRRLLYVEDNEANIAVMREFAAMYPGLELQVDTDPLAGLARAVRWQPDLIALDIALPHLDGYELLKRIRAEPSLAKVPVVAVTGNALPADRERGREAGFAAYCTKPLRIADFMQVLNDLMPKEAPHA